jgi:hypothetical protein
MGFLAIITLLFTGYLLYKVFKKKRSVKPTGTISIVAGISSGIEPIFQREYVRKIRLGDK